MLEQQSGTAKFVRSRYETDWLNRAEYASGLGFLGWMDQIFLHRSHFDHPSRETTMSASAGFPDVLRDANAFEIALANGVDFIYALFAGGNHSPIVRIHSFMLDASGEVP